ncbi:MAG: hypothetical protein WBM09_13050 [Gallionella sp.]
MNTCISGSYFTRAQAVMRTLGFGLVVVGYAIASHAAHADTFGPGVDLVSIPLAYSLIGNDRPVNLDANTNLDANNGAPDRFGGMPRLPDYFKNLKNVASWVASISWHMTEEDSRASFSPHLRVESKETLILIEPLDHSITMMWHRRLE